MRHLVPFVRASRYRPPVIRRLRAIVLVGIVMLILGAWTMPCLAVKKIRTIKDIIAEAERSMFLNAGASQPSAVPNKSNSSGQFPYHIPHTIAAKGDEIAKHFSDLLPDTKRQTELEPATATSAAQEALYALKQELDDAGSSTVVKTENGQTVLEERGFDIVQRAILRTLVDKSGVRPEEKAALLFWRGSEAIFSIFRSNAPFHEGYTVESNSAYDPYYLMRNDKGFRFVSSNDISCMSSLCEDRPLDLGDGWGLLEKNGAGWLIAKHSKPNDIVFMFLSRPRELTSEWAFQTLDGEIILPKENPVQTHRDQSFRVVENKSGQRQLVDGFHRRKRSSMFTGQPLDYIDSVLLDVGNGYQLVSKLSLENTSDLLTEKPKLEDRREYVTVKETKHKRVVLLINPKTKSPEFDEVVEKVNDLWVVSHKSEQDGKDIYNVFSPFKPDRAWGPYTVQPKRIKDSNGEWVLVDEPGQKRRWIASKDPGERPTIIWNRGDGTR